MSKYNFASIVGLLFFSTNTSFAQTSVTQPTNALVVPPAKHRAVVQLSSEAQARRKQEADLDNDALTAFSSGKYAEAEDAARLSLAIGPGTGVSEEVLGAVLVIQGKNGEALDTYTDIIEAHKDTMPRNLLPYALLELNSGNWAKAVSAYNAALPHVPNGTLLATQTTFNPNVLQQQALEEAIHIALGLTYRGRAFIAVRSSDEQADSEFKQAVNIDPISPLANLYYAYSLKRTGHTSEANELFNQVSSTSLGDIKAAADKAIANQ